MNRSNLFKKIVKLEGNVDILTQETAELRSLAIRLVEEDITLQIKNDNLKMLMTKSERGVESTKANSRGPHNKKSNENDFKSTIKNVEKPLPSKGNLAILYSEGFRIYNGELFGKHRYGEDCLLYMNILNS